MLAASRSCELPILTRGETAERILFVSLLEKEAQLLMSTMKPCVTSFAPQFLVDDLKRSIAYYQRIGFTFSEPTARKASSERGRWK